MKGSFLRQGLVIFLVSIGMGAQSYAVDAATEAGKLVEIYTTAVKSQANCAFASLSGGVSASMEANKQAEAVDNLIAVANNAYMEFERALASGDQAAAASASNQLSAALQQAKQAQQGITTMPKPSPVNQARKNTGGGPGKAGDMPNPYDVPWKSDHIRQLYQSLFGNFLEASSFGGTLGFGDREATPQ